MARFDEGEDAAVIKALGWDAQEDVQPSLLEKAFDVMPFSDATSKVNRRYVHLTILIIYVCFFAVLPAFILTLTIIFVLLVGIWAYVTYRSDGLDAIYRATQPLYDELDRTYDLSARYERYKWLQEYRAQRAQRESFERAIPPLTEAEWHLLVDTVGGCEIRTCGMTGELIVHRITPRHDGGTNNLRNLIVLCPKHNDDVRFSIISKRTLQEIARAKAKRFRTPIWSQWRW